MSWLPLLLHTVALAAPVEEAVAVEPEAGLVDLPGFFVPLPDELPARPAGPYRIWNGQANAPGEHPAVVALAQPWGKSLFVFCSGSLITPEWVLTAAHCIDSYPKTVVVFGDDLTKGEIYDLIDAAELLPHPTYDAAKFLNDVGLVRLAEKKKDVDPVVLNDEPITDADHGRVLTILGFGITYDAGDGSGVKRITHAPIQTHNSQYVISYDPNTNVCQGDSGGPAFESTFGDQLEQVGINAYVSPSCVGGKAGLTRVDKWIDWILSYAPDALLEPQEFRGLPEEPPPPEPLASEAIDRDLGEVPLPGSYPVGVGCDATGGAAGGGLVLGALLALGRRRRAR